MSFYRLPYMANNVYTINDEELERVGTYKDLGVLFDSGLTFAFHVESIVARGLRMLGFIKRNTRHLSDTKALHSLYNCLVRSILEYCSIVWTPFYECYKSRIESVQKKFVNYLLFKHRFPYANLSYHTRLQLCGLKTLEQRRREHLLLFLCRLVHGEVSSSYLLENVNIRIPRHSTRLRQLFYARGHRTNYGSTAFSDRIMKNYNDEYSNIDIIFWNVDHIKRSLL